MKSNALRSMFVALGFGMAAVAAGPALADVTFFPPITNFEDDNVEAFTDTSLSTEARVGIIDVGDRFQGVLEIAKTFGTFGGGPATLDLGGGTLELSGIFDWTVSSKTFAGNGVDGILGTTDDVFTFTFIPTAGGDLAGLGAGAMIAMYTDATPDLSVLPPTPACLTLACLQNLAGLGDAGSTLWAVAGYTPGDLADQFAAYTGTANIAAINAANASTLVALGNYGFGVIFNGTGQTIVPMACAASPAGNDGKVDVCGSGSVLGGAGLPDYLDMRSDIDFEITTTVPEPTSLALAGLALLGLGFSRRRNRKI